MGSPLAVLLRFVPLRESRRVGNIMNLSLKKEPVLGLGGGNEIMSYACCDVSSNQQRRGEQPCSNCQRWANLGRSVAQVTDWSWIGRPFRKSLPGPPKAAMRYVRNPGNTTGPRLCSQTCSRSPSSALLPIFGGGFP